MQDLAQEVERRRAAPALALLATDAGDGAATMFDRVQVAGDALVTETPGATVLKAMRRVVH